MSAPGSDEADEAMEQAALWCLLLSEGSLSAEDESAFEAWIAMPGNARHFERAIAVWQSSGDVGGHPEILPLRNNALARFRQANQRRWLRTSWPRLRYLLPLAATLALFIVGSVIWLGRADRVLETRQGERQVAMLDDGSRVSLDADTGVDVVLDADQRKITLTRGRAKFDVAKDPLRPFTVSAGGKVIVAVGTSFSVELIGGKLVVLLYEGQVEVRNADDRGPRGASVRQTMSAGHELIADIGSTGAGKVLAPDMQPTLNWEQGMVSFDEEPLVQAVERMNRYSRTQIVIGDPAISQLPVSGGFEADDQAAFIEGVSQILKLQPERDGDVITLRALRTSTS